MSSPSLGDKSRSTETGVHPDDEDLWSTDTSPGDEIFQNRGLTVFGYSCSFRFLNFSVQVLMKQAKLTSRVQGRECQETNR